MKKTMNAMMVLLLALSGCGGMEIPGLDSLYLRQPRVVSVEPTDGAVVGADSMIAVEFSQQIDPSTVDPSTLAVVKDEESAAADIASAVVKGDAVGIDGVYEFAGEGRVAIFRPREPYEQGASYKIVATSGILSVEMLPLVGRAGGAKAAFMSGFLVGEGGDGSSSSSGGSSGGSGSSGGQTAQVARPSFLVINEILYDVPGDDTNGVLFIELFGEAATSVGGYKILLINGDNGATTEEISIPKQAAIPDDGIFLIADSKTGQSGVSAVEGADFVDNFDPQNGPDCVILQDEKGEVVDALGYGLPITTPAANGQVCFEGTPAARAASGASLSRIEGTDTGDNSADFFTPASPTPGVL